VSDRRGQRPTVGDNETIDFFISYTEPDIRWAEWIAWQLEAAEYTVLVQAWDAVPGSHLTSTLQTGITRADRTLALLSDAYLSSIDGNAEWQAVLRDDPGGLARKLVPVRIENCQQRGLLGQVARIDLFGLSQDDARRRLLDQVAAAKAGRLKPPVEPAFPGLPAVDDPPHADKSTNVGEPTSIKEAIAVDPPPRPSTPSPSTPSPAGVEANHPPALPPADSEPTVPGVPGNSGGDATRPTVVIPRAAPHDDHRRRPSPSETTPATTSPPVLRPSTGPPVTPTTTPPTTPPIPPPDAPRVQVSSASGAVTVTVSAPPGGGPVSSYIVTANPGGVRTLNAPGAITIPVAACARTTVTAQAEGAGGTSPRSTPATALGCVPPSTPLNVTSKTVPGECCGLTDTLVTWDAPADGGGGTIEYVVTVHISTGSTETDSIYVTSDTKYQRGSATGRDQYNKITVAARNGAGTGPAVIGYSGSVP